MKIPAKVWLAAAFFALCVAPTFISYQSYLFRWDDAEYLERAIHVSEGFWSRNKNEIHEGMVGIHPPVMTLLGLPWGPVHSWDAAGKCFVSLAALTALLVALCLFLLLRIGLKPIFLGAASACLFASMGPFPPPSDSFSTHFAAIRLLADVPFAWTAFAAVLLIPYEAGTDSLSVWDGIVRGILWAFVFSLGAVTKASFFYFVVLILPILLAIRFRRGGLGTSLAAFAAAFGFSAPAIVYWLRWGQLAWDNARSASFGPMANFFYTPLVQFVGSTVRESPGVVLAIALVAVGFVWLLFTKRTVWRSPKFLALLIMIGFGIVALASPARLVRYIYSDIVAVPLLLGVLLSDQLESVRERSAVLVSGLVFCGLVVASLPMLHRPNIQSLNLSDRVLAQTVRCDSKRILLATDSPTLNLNLMQLAVAISPMKTTPELATLLNSGAPIGEDFRTIKQSDQVVFQDTDAASSPLGNEKASEYEQFVQHDGEYGRVDVASDVRVYVLHCDSR